ncbi:hypothetical protein AB4Y42_35190 [Paraburkholderia sp. EG286B]|uniref:hypothetical protein n=1 Tax=unclassified Paraburkholderia TaxID=2615204 RepID=UPI0034D27244
MIYSGLDRENLYFLRKNNAFVWPAAEGDGRGQRSTRWRQDATNSPDIFNLANAFRRLRCPVTGISGSAGEKATGFIAAASMQQAAAHLTRPGSLIG